MHTDHDEHHLVKELFISSSYIPELSIVAEVEGIMVGHILFTKMKIGQHNSLSLAPLAVLPLYQNKGIGNKLIEYGHHQARKMGYQHCVVLGHPTYYPRFGYRPSYLYSIYAPFDVVPKEALMVIELENGSLQEIKGCVSYDAAFGLKNCE